MDINIRLENLQHEIMSYYGTRQDFGIIALKIGQDYCIDIDYWYYNVSTIRLMRIQQHIRMLVKERIGSNYKTKFNKQNI